MIQTVARSIRSAGRRVAGFIHIVAGPGGVAQSNQEIEGKHPSAVSGVMIAGAGSEFGKAANEMPDDHDPERDWRDR